MATKESFLQTIISTYCMLHTSLPEQICFITYKLYVYKTAKGPITVNYHIDDGRLVEIINNKGSWLYKMVN